jgi:predicted nucleic acid-binding protein
VPEKDFFLSVITIGEITKGITKLPMSHRRQNLESWFSHLQQRHAPRILPVDIEIARIWGEITAKAAQMGRVVPVNDGLIAATALRHGLHIMTRNSADFQATGALLIDPWES